MKINLELKEKYGSKVIGQVIRILDEHTVIISVGKNDVHIDDHLQIYEYLGELIASDGQNYGSIEYVKAEVEVIRVEPNYSICKTEMIDTPSKLSFALSPLLESPAKHRANLPVDKTDIEPLNPQDCKVRIGDPVKRA